MPKDYLEKKQSSIKSKYLKMKNVKQILDQFKEQNIKLILKDESNIEVLSYDKKLTSDQIDIIKENKSSIIQYLKAENNSVLDLLPTEQQENYTLSNSQKRLWVVSQIPETSVAYNLPVVVKLNGKYEIANLFKAFEETIKRHEILRTVFKKDIDGELKQWIVEYDELDYSFEFKDLSNETFPEVESTKIIDSDSYRLFDLENGPLLRLQIHKLEEEQIVVYFNMHHIISDEWSMDILSRDAMAFYEAITTNTEPNLPQLNVQFKDYVNWELKQKEGEAFQSKKEFWANQLQGELPKIDLPGQKPRAKFKTGEGTYIATHLSQSLSQSLVQFVTNNNGSLFTGLIAALNVLLHKYTSKNDIIIGSPIVGRDHHELQNQIGFYINSLVLRNNIDQTAGFNQFYNQVRENTLQCLEHKSYPFDTIFEDLNLSFDMSRSPIFDISLTLHNKIEIQNDTKPDESFSTKDAICKNDIEFHFQEINDYISFDVNFNKDLYDVETIQAFMTHFKQLLKVLLDDPEKAIQELNYLSAEEQNELLVAFNSNSLEYPTETTLLSLFEEQVKNTPEAIAIVFQDKKIKYKELDEISNQLANCLVNDHKVEKGDLIGIHLDRNEQFIITLLGILKAGAAYLPIDTNYPSKRKEYIISDSNIKMLVTSTTYMFDFGYYEKDLLALDVEFNPSDFSSEAVDSNVLPEDLAYVIYTSGSTGMPKGVEIQHKGIVNTVLGQIEMMGFKSCKRSLQFASFSFDASIAEIFTTLFSGAELYVIDENQRKTPQLLENYIQENKIELATIPPSFFKIMDINSLKSIKVLLTAGESPVYEKVLSYLSNGGVYFNAYGPTEVSVCGSAFKMTKETILNSKNIPIGIPIPNTKTYILDSNNNLQPKGVPGEICIGGFGVAKGYRNREEETQKKFINNPFVENEKLYKTGDIGRWLSDGSIEFLGRIDHQVKLRGNRIELGEIISQILLKEDINDAVVLINQDNNDEKELVAYVVSDKKQNSTDLRKFLSESLPDYMLPNKYIQIDEIPLSVSGKVDDKKLQQLNSEGLSSEVEYIAPKDEIEQKLQRIWEDLLNVKKVSMKDDFFILGGQSLKATTLINEYQKNFNVKISLVEIFKHTTLDSHSQLVKSASNQTFKNIEVVDQQKSYPISDAQNRLWILSQYEGGSEAYHLPQHFVVELDDVQSFGKAIEAVFERHEILRTVFRKNENQEINQWILPFNKLKFEIDYKDFSGEILATEKAEKYIEDDIYKAFDLEKGPLVRMGLFKINENQYVFYYNMHHIISDGWSIDILHRDVMAYYNFFTNNIPLNLPELNIQYKDYASWQLKQVASEDSNLSKKYWLEQLQGEIPTIDLPSIKKRPAVKTYNGHNLSFQLPSDVTQELRTISQEAGGTLFMGLLTIWKIMIYRYTSQNDITVGTAVAGRDHADLVDQIGFYVNTIALRNKISSEKSFRQTLIDIKETTLTAYDHQMYPFDKVVNDLNKPINLSRNPLFDSILTLQNIGDRNDKKTVKSDTVYDLGSAKAKFDLSVTFEEMEESLSFDVVYNIDVYDGAMISNLMLHFKNILKEVLKNPDIPINTIDYLLPEEKKTQLIKFNSTEQSYPKDKTIVELFEMEVDKNPDNIALIHDIQKVTYFQLNMVANQFGNYLRSNYNIKPDDLIGIKLDRSDKMILALLGVLKSGGAYVPIDPNYPIDRIEYIEEQSNLKLIIDEKELEEFFTSSNQYSKSNISKINNVHSLCYVTFTSGTTGKPKGVMVENKAVVRLVKNTNYMTITNGDRVISLSNFSFDGSIFDFFMPLLNGATLVLPSKEELLDVTKLESILINNKITAFFITTALFNSLVDHSDLQFEDLKYIVFGGETASVNHVNKFKLKNKSVNLANVYGPTENTTFSTYYTIEENNNTIIPIGKPISNSKIYILDDQLSLVPIGSPGKIYVGGDGLARGYLNNPDLTNEKFISNPFYPNQRIYDTGDIGRWTPNGNIEFLGRKDNQVKIRGFRIELSEIESGLLEANAHLKQAIVDVKEVNDQKVIVAYFVSDLQNIDKKEIKSNLKKLLPDFMLPNYYVQLNEIPLTSNGKVNMNALPTIEEKDLIKEEFVLPTNQEEKILVKVWSEVLKQEYISTKDSFYNLGGDSIKSIQVVARLKQHGYTLKIENILRNPVIEDLAKLLKSTENVINQDVVKGEAILTPIQHYFFNNDEIENKNHFNQSVVLKSKTVIDSDVLQKAVNKLVLHHDALRMSYQNNNGIWSQYNEDVPETEYKINFYDLRGKTNELEELNTIGQELQSGFNLSEGNLFTIGHFRMTDGDRLALIVHHAVIDGVSWRILFEDLSNLYQSYELNQTYQLPLKTDSYQRWGSLQAEYAKSEKMQSEREYWENRIKENCTSFPTDFEQTEKTNLLDEAQYFELDSSITQKLQTKVNQVYNTNINDILLTALAFAVKDTFGVEKSVIKMEGHGREDLFEELDISRTIGWFTSIFPFLLDISNAGGNELIKVKESLRKIPNKGVGYGILNYLDIPFKNNLKESIQFNYLGDFGNKIGNENQDSKFEFSSESIGSSLDKANEKSSVLLDISGMMSSGQLSFSVRFSTTTFYKETIEKFVASYKNQLENLIHQLAEKEERILTPSDLTYTNLKIDELLSLNHNTTIEDIYELSHLQEGLYYQWLLDKSSSAYSVQISYRINSKDLVIENVKQAYQMLIMRYPILRTSFTNDYGKSSLQIVHKSGTTNFSYDSITDVENREEKLNTIKQTDKALEFDLENPTQMRLKVVDLGNSEYEFIWSNHHIIMDGWCISILINDFYSILTSLSNNEPIHLPPTSKYSTYISWLTKLDKKGALHYWENYLKGNYAKTELPFKQREITTNTAVIKSEILQLEGQQFQNIKNTCLELNITQNSFFQGVWGYLLSQYNNSDEAIFGSIVSGRPGDLEGVENCVGLFINTIPVRVKYSTEDTIETFLKRVHTNNLQSTPHHYLNLSDVQSKSHLKMELITNVVAFENYLVQEQNQQTINKDVNELSVKDINSDEHTNYDFNINIAPTPTSLIVEFKYNSNVFDANLIQNLVEHYTRIINHFTENTAKIVTDLDYLTDDEKEENRVVGYWNTIFSDGIPKVKFPFEKQRLQENATTRETIDFHINAKLKKELENTSAKNGGDLGLTSLLLLNVCIQKYTQSQSTMIGFSFPKTDSNGQKQLTKNYNYLPVVAQFNDEDTLENVYQILNDSLKSTASVSSFPFENVLQKIEKVPDGFNSSFFNVTLNYNPINEFINQGETLGSSFEKVKIPCDFSLNFFEKENEILGQVNYNNDLFDPSHIELFIERFLNVMNQIIEKSDSFDQTALKLITLDNAAEALNQIDSELSFEEKF